MRFHANLLPLIAAFSIAISSAGQSTSDAVRVTVSMNDDGSRTVYRFDSANHKATAETSGADGKLRGRILYELDAAGRFASGQVLTANGSLRFKTLYKYNGSGLLADETQMSKDGSVLHKIVYTYDSSGQQTGYAIYDGSGNLMGQTGKKPASAKGRP
jgi:hypothetical protein